MSAVRIPVCLVGVARRIAVVEAADTAASVCVIYEIINIIRAYAGDIRQVI